MWFWKYEEYCFILIGKGKCSRCGKDVICWGDLSKELCMTCDEKENLIPVTMDCESK